MFQVFVYVIFYGILRSDYLHRFSVDTHFFNNATEFFKRRFVYGIYVRQVDNYVFACGSRFDCFHKPGVIDKENGTLHLNRTLFLRCLLYTSDAADE